MWGLAVAIALSAAPGQFKLASPGLAALNVTREVATFYSDHLAQQLALRGLAVMTGTEINSLLGLERQRQLMGCSNEETASCMAELADALGVDGIVTGTIGKLDGRFQIDVKIVSSRSASTLGLFTGSASSEREVLGALVEASASLHEQLVANLKRVPAAEAAAAGPGPARYWWAPAAVGVAGMLLGAVMAGLVTQNLGTLRTATAAELDYDGAMRVRSTASAQQTVSIVAFAVGGAALIAAGALAVFGGPVSVAPQVSPTGAGVTLAGTWP